MWQGSYRNNSGSERSQRRRKRRNSGHKKEANPSPERLRAKPRIPLALRRISAAIELLDEEREIMGLPRVAWKTRILLSDVSADGLGMFSTVPCLPGQEIVLRLDHPKPFFIRARVIWCREYDTSNRVLSEAKYIYRVGLEFEFATPEESRVVDAFFQALIEDPFSNPSL